MRCKPGELHPLSEEEAACGVALFRSLKERDGRWVAVRASGPLNWDIAEPRTQDDLLAALNTAADDKFDAEFDHVCQQEADEREDEAELYREQRP